MFKSEYFVGRGLKWKSSIFATMDVAKQRQVDPPMDFTYQRGIQICIVYTMGTHNLHFSGL